MNIQALINGIVQQTTVLIAHVATFGGTRAPLAQVANQVFIDLTNELQRQGVKKNVIADMFGMALRTYHRRIRTLTESQTDSGRIVWDAVLDFIRDNQPVSLRQIKKRFGYDDPNIVSGVLGDMTQSGFVYRSGQGEASIFRLAEEADFAHSQADERREANEYLVWLNVYRLGKASPATLGERSGLEEEELGQALATLMADGRVVESRDHEGLHYHSRRFDIPMGHSGGWEVAVLDHFQAMVSAVCVKLRGGALRADLEDATGGSTFTLEVWPGHPLEQEAKGLLAATRESVEALRERIDDYNREHGKPDALDAVTFYLGQFIKQDEVDDDLR
ncbi:MAG: hypothetical protein OEZ06_27955 [Myxococcales bacterium]|nr:hypothetical protein [Myxococcales bacterium]